MNNNTMIAPHTRRALFLNARDLLGDGASVADTHPEYIRGMVELIAVMLGVTTDEFRDRIHAVVTAPNYDPGQLDVLLSDMGV